MYVEPGQRRAERSRVGGIGRWIGGVVISQAARVWRRAKGSVVWRLGTTATAALADEVDVT